jgi:NIPSNAP
LGLPTEPNPDDVPRDQAEYWLALRLAIGILTRNPMESCGAASSPTPGLLQALGPFVSGAKSCASFWFNGFMKKYSVTLLAMGIAMITAMIGEVANAAEKLVYEMRVYYAPPGKLEALHNRFRSNTMRLFEKHGMKNLGYWVPLENPENKLIYILGHASRDAAKKSWSDFMADSDWKKAWKESERTGSLVAKIEVFFMDATDYSPPFVSPEDGSPRVFELRTYTASAGKLPNLHARFRDHTLKLFEKHGMTNLGYWSLQPDQAGAGETLIYLLAHRSKDAGAASFDSFRKDPVWQAARQASEQAAGGSLTAKDGVKSLYLAPTDYSPIK